MDCREKLIKAVRKFPILYDRKVHGYKLPDLSRQSWQRVAFIVGLDVRTCKKKWKSLRNSYARAFHQKYQFPNKKIGCKYFEALSFLEEHINPKIYKNFVFDESGRNYLSGSEALAERNGLNGTSEHIHPLKSLANDDSALDINDSLDFIATNAPKKSSVIEQNYNASIHEKFYEDVLKEIKREDEFDAADLYFKNLSQIVKGQQLSIFNLLDLQSKLSKFLQDELAKYSCHQ